MLTSYQRNNDCFTALCPGLLWSASTRRNNIHPPSNQLSSNLYQLLPSTTIHSILPVQITCLAIFLHNLSPSPLVYLLVWSPPPHIPSISSPNQIFFSQHMPIYVISNIAKTALDFVLCKPFRNFKLHCRVTCIKSTVPQKQHTTTEYI